MKRCLNCGITSGIKDSDNYCRSCGGTQFESATNNKNQDLAKRVKTLEKKVATLEAQIQERQETTVQVDGKIIAQSAYREQLHKGCRIRQVAQK